MRAPSRQGRLLPVALALVLVLAGCSIGGGPSPTAPSTTIDGGSRTITETSTRSATKPTPTTASPSPPIQTPEEAAAVPPGHVAVEGGTLPVNATLIFQRVEELLGVEADAPTIRIRQPQSDSGLDTDPDADTDTDTAHPSRLSDPDRVFDRRLGIAPPAEGLSDPPSGLGGGARTDEVTLKFYDSTPATVDRERLELVIAHEFVHVIQFQRRVDRSLNRVAATKTALLEGSAVFVTDRYARKYGLTYPGDQLPIERWVQEYPTLPPWHGTLGAQYHFGAQYVDRRIDDATEVWSVYDDPPETMEQVIHGDDAGPERSLSLAPLAPGWTVTYKGARGEHEVRAIMRGVLDGEEAAVAAAGWGSDELLEFAPKDGDEDVVGHVWVLRWDDASEADECADALRKVARARAAVVDASFQVVRAAPETVVLLTGPTGFVNDVTVSGTNERVTIAIEAPMR